MTSDKPELEVTYSGGFTRDAWVAPAGTDRPATEWRSVIALSINVPADGSVKRSAAYRAMAAEFIKQAELDEAVGQ